MLTRAPHSATGDAALRERARRVIPGGMWGHMNAAFLPAGYPQFYNQAAGTRLTDADGRTTIDFMCAFGPMITGYGDREVEEAAAAQAADVRIANGPAPIMVDLAELMVDMLPAADWVMFSKNGTDATTACVSIARAATGRRKVLVAEGAYHGAAPWCTPWPGGVLAEDRAHLSHYAYNDVASLAAAVDAAGDDLAAIMASAFKHDSRVDQELPTREFATEARRLADRAGGALILDDVRAGFRLDLAGSWNALGVDPDLSAWSKAMGNGHAIAAVTGKDALADAASKVFVTGSFWCEPSAMAASKATLAKLRRSDAVAHMARLGVRLREGIAAQAAAAGVAVRQTGPAQMPLILFDDDPDLAKGNLFALTALQRGAFLHPWHNMFLSLAHTDEDVDAALQATDAAMQAVAASL
ncbi:aminotransferase class III-fold pyridoxal phosphate-dependent enzyme [Acuticoccus sp.]|uniref:aminotransferase class III-fold pyridoxal phosphate-dependent enzyme n=1 Tax=Acuticoccus sp. TaxID=1904378 RepID=UPI003B51F832